MDTKFKIQIFKSTRALARPAGTHVVRPYFELAVSTPAYDCFVVTSNMYLSIIATFLYLSVYSAYWGLKK